MSELSYIYSKMYAKVIINRIIEITQNKRGKIMNPFLLVAIKLLIGFFAMVIIINLSGKGNLAPSSASDQIVNISKLENRKRFKMKKQIKTTEAIFPMPVLLISTFNEDGTVDVMKY